MKEMSDKEKTIYFITGASGVGKTTLVEQLRKKYEDMPWAFFHFDSIGVPSEPEMEKEFGSPTAWQKAKTYEWIEKLVHVKACEKIFFEGQVNLEFIRQAFEKQNFKNYVIILLDCSEQEMERRLINDRKQPELFDAHMRNWLKFLRNQAEECGAIQIDTSCHSKVELANVFENAIDLRS